MWTMRLVLFLKRRFKAAISPKPRLINSYERSEMNNSVYIAFIKKTSGLYFLNCLHLRCQFGTNSCLFILFLKVKHCTIYMHHSNEINYKFYQFWNDRDNKCVITNIYLNMSDLYFNSLLAGWYKIGRRNRLLLFRFLWYFICR